MSRIRFTVLSGLVGFVTIPSVFACPSPTMSVFERTTCDDGGSAYLLKDPYQKSDDSIDGGKGCIYVNCDNGGAAGPIALNYFLNLLDESTRKKIVPADGSLNCDSIASNAQFSATGVIRESFQTMVAGEGAFLRTIQGLQDKLHPAAVPGTDPTFPLVTSYSNDADIRSVISHYDPKSRVLSGDLFPARGVCRMIKAILNPPIMYGEDGKKQSLTVTAIRVTCDGTIAQKAATFTDDRILDTIPILNTTQNRAFAAEAKPVLPRDLLTDILSTATNVTTGSTSRGCGIKIEMPSPGTDHRPPAPGEYRVNGLKD